MACHSILGLKWGSIKITRLASGRSSPALPDSRLICTRKEILNRLAEKLFAAHKPAAEPRFVRPPARLGRGPKLPRLHHLGLVSSTVVDYQIDFQVLSSSTDTTVCRKAQMDPGSADACHECRAAFRRVL